MLLRKFYSICLNSSFNHSKFHNVASQSIYWNNDMPVTCIQAWYNVIIYFCRIKVKILKIETHFINGNGLTSNKEFTALVDFMTEGVHFSCFVLGAWRYPSIFLAIRPPPQTYLHVDLVKQFGQFVFRWTSSRTILVQLIIT